MGHEVSINIKICNRNYKLKVAAENEQKVRKSITTITENIEKFHQNFPGRDDQDYMAMTLIDFITSAQNTGSQSNEEDALIKKLEQINHLLDT
ncbi:MAG: cell division protein ZapA [Chitinophagaceae bacterium]|nr:cell division protein ZapA [Chitinophagaceae bacterium]